MRDKRIPASSFNPPEITSYIAYNSYHFYPDNLSLCSLLQICLMVVCKIIFIIYSGKLKEVRPCLHQTHVDIVLLTINVQSFISLIVCD